MNIFVLISGYFLAGNSNTDYRLSAKWVLNNWKQLMFYSILLGAALFYRDGYSASRLFKADNRGILVHDGFYRLNDC